MTSAKLALACLIFVAAALPSDANNIWTGLVHPDPTATWKLSLGLSLKTLMGVFSVAGLWADQTYGYAFLLGSSAQCLLVRGGEFMALQGMWSEHWGQLVWPGCEALFRLFCLGYLALHWRRMVGIREVNS